MTLVERRRIVLGRACSLSFAARPEAVASMSVVTSRLRKSKLVETVGEAVLCRQCGGCLLRRLAHLQP
jgi:hypothetical protein